MRGPEPGVALDGFNECRNRFVEAVLQMLPEPEFLPFFGRRRAILREERGGGGQKKQNVGRNVRSIASGPSEWIVGRWRCR